MIDSIILAFSIALFLLLIPVGLVVLLYLLILVVYLILIGYASIMVAGKNTMKWLKKKFKRKDEPLVVARGAVLDRMALMYGVTRGKKTILGFIKIKESDKALRLRLLEILKPSVAQACERIRSDLYDG